MIARTTFFALLVIVTGLALYPHLQLPEMSAIHGYLDKIGHALGFATLAILGVCTWQCRWPLIGGLVCYAVILELLQSFSPGREVGVCDALANLFGLAIGFGLAMTVRRAKVKST